MLLYTSVDTCLLLEGGKAAGSGDRGGPKQLCPGNCSLQLWAIPSGVHGKPWRASQVAGDRVMVAFSSPLEEVKVLTKTVVVLLD